MREIKFRAWDKKYNCWFNGFFVDWNDGSIYWKLQGDICAGKNEDVVLMQFTGLLDRNGKKIYENDVVKFVAIDLDQFKHEGIGVITWDDSDTGFYIDSNIDKFPHVKTYYTENLEVIGNIYEHKHLLEGKQC